MRTGPQQWIPLGRPEYLRQQAELSLRRLKVDVIDLFQLHRIDASVDRDEQFGVLKELQDEGKVRALGLSQVSVDDIAAAQRIFTVATVQNRYNLTDRSSADVLELAEADGIGFIPWAAVSAGELARPGGPVDSIARRLGATPAQVALAWVLQASPVMLPIPGTGSIEHLEDNLAAASSSWTTRPMRRSLPRADPFSPEPRLLGLVLGRSITDRADPTNQQLCVWPQINSLASNLRVSSRAGLALAGVPR